jgi:cytochrome c
MDPNGRPAGTMPVILASADATAQTEAEAPAEPEVVETATIDPALLAEGEKQFRKCSACHKVGEGAKNGTGPHLNGIVGRTAGTVDGFRYSKPMADAGAGGLVWDEASLHAFLENPKGFIARNKMSYNGMKKEGERAAVIAYLTSLTE